MHIAKMHEVRGLNNHRGRWLFTERLFIWASRSLNCVKLLQSILLFLRICCFGDGARSGPEAIVFKGS